MWVSCPQACIAPVDGRGERQAGVLLHRQRVHVAAQQHGRPRAPAVEHRDDRADATPRCTSSGRSASAATTASRVRGSSRPSSGWRCSARRSATVRGCMRRACMVRPASSGSAGGMTLILAPREGDVCANFGAVAWTTVGKGLTVVSWRCRASKRPRTCGNRPCPGMRSRRSGRTGVGAAPASIRTRWSTSTPPSPSCGSCAPPAPCSACSTSTTSSSCCCAPRPAGCRCMLSDAVAALDYDVAADVLDLLRVELPPEDDDDDDPWPEGDLGDPRRSRAARRRARGARRVRSSSTRTSSSPRSAGAAASPTRSPRSSTTR